MIGRLRLIAVLLLCSATASSARAGGLYLADRGSRALGRGGALVAGAEGLEGIGYNPAAIAGAGTSLLADFSLAVPRVRYTRRLHITDPDGTTHVVESPPVEGTAELIPFPTLATAIDLGDRWTLAGGLYSPQFALVSYPDTVQGQPSPSRYMLGSLSDSRLGMPGLWLGVRAHENLDVGFGVQTLVGLFRSSITFSMSLPDRLLAAPEAPDYDAMAALEVGPIVSPTGSAGILWRALPQLRIGLSAQLPIWINAPARIDVRLPDSATFDTVEVDGNKARVKLRLPAVLRAGVQVQPVDAVQIELAYVNEMWSMHDRISARPQGIQVRGIVGGPESLELPDIEVPRGFRDSHSIRLGVDYRPPLLGGRMRLRAGLSHERSGVPPSYLSLGSMDFDKTGFHAGLGLVMWEGWSVDMALMHMRTRTVDVSPDDAQLVRINPLGGNAPPEPINGGTYTMGATVVAVSSLFRFGASPSTRGEPHD